MTVTGGGAARQATAAGAGGTQPARSEKMTRKGRQTDEAFRAAARLVFAR